MVDVANRAQPHDVVPFQALRKHLECLGLVLHLGKTVRIVPVRDAHQDAIAIGFDIPDVEITRRRHQATIIIVRRVFQSVVIGIGFPTGFKQFHLILLSHLAKHVDGVLDACLVAVELYVVGHYVPHPQSQCSDVIAIKYFPIAFLDTAIETFGNGVLHVQLATWEKVLSRLVEQEAQGPEVYQTRCVVREVKEFNIAAVVDAKLQSLRHIVNLS